MLSNFTSHLPAYPFLRPRTRTAPGDRRLSGPGPFPERPLPPTPPVTQSSPSSQQHPQRTPPNHDDVALPWSWPRQCDIAVVADEGRCGLLRRKLLVGLQAEAGRAYPGRNIPNGPGCPPRSPSARSYGGALPGTTGHQCR